MLILFDICLSLIKLFFLYDVANVLRNHNPILYSFMTYHRVLTRVSQRVPHAVQELFSLMDPLDSPPVISMARVVRSLIFCVTFCRSLSVLLFFFRCPLHCLSVFDSRLRITPLWYLQTFLPPRA